MKDVCLRSWSCAADQTIETLVLAMTTFHVSLGLLALFSAEAPLPLGKLVPPPTFAEFWRLRRNDTTHYSSGRFRHHSDHSGSCNTHVEDNG